MEPDAVEIRVVGCLVEKQRTTPDAYPLTLNSLRLACNQSTNRDPVADYDESTIRGGLNRLRERGWTTLATWSNRRAMKYRHTLNSALGLDDAEIALLCVLMLRGAQTPGELKSRSERLHRFEDASGIDDTLRGLIERDLVRRLERRPGQREERFEQLLGGAEGGPGAAAARLARTEPSGEPAMPSGESPDADPAPPTAAPAPPAVPEADLAERVGALEREVAELRGQLRALREELGA